MTTKILIGAPIKQDPAILDLYLRSLARLNKTGFTVDYCFVDDNNEEASSTLLREFQTQNTVALLEGKKSTVYSKSQETHLWREELIWNVASFKNQIIQFSLDHGYDYVFFVDSDLILHPTTLLRLVETDKDIVSEVFWTKWKPQSIELPQVWVCDAYTLYHKGREEQLSSNEASVRIQRFIQQLRVPGVYEVGGLGALTLIKRGVFEKGVNFSEIKNISFGGEDRHFCIRACAYGFDLFVDTHFPAFHIYRNSDLTLAKTLI